MAASCDQGPVRGVQCQGLGIMQPPRDTEHLECYIQLCMLRYIQYDMGNEAMIIFSDFLTVSSFNARLQRITKLSSFVISNVPEFPLVARPGTVDTRVQMMTG